MPQCIRAFRCTVQGTPANLTRNHVRGGFVGQESREGYGYTSINTTIFTHIWVIVRHKHQIYGRDGCPILDGGGRNARLHLYGAGDDLLEKKFWVA